MAANTLAIIFNIPSQFGSADLRRFFTTFVEAQKFECFHYKRRPESKLEGFDRKLFMPDSERSHGVDTNIAIAKLAQAKFVKDFCSFYHMKHWTHKDDTDMTSRCLVFELPDSLKLPANLSELRAPGVAPQGNVGTPSKYFVEATRQCRLSTKVISKLGLNFNERRGRTFSAVPPPSDLTDGSNTRKNRRRQQEPVNLNQPSQKAAKLSDPKQDQNAAFKDDNSDQEETKDQNEEYEEEEWDRHRALHDDVSARRVVKDVDDLNDQPGTKDRLFEEKMEVTWDKGSSGLVFYTDAQFWREAENHEEAEDADDWDVDTAEYEVAGSGDKDARDAADMRRSDAFRSANMTESVFSKKAKKRPTRVGSFESHTKGIGRRLLEDSGWKDGDGLGSRRQGRPEAVDSRGQHGRSGLGYSGKLVNEGNPGPSSNYYSTSTFRKETSSSNHRHDEDDNIIHISTIYDKE